MVEPSRSCDACGLCEAVRSPVRSWESGELCLRPARDLKLVDRRERAYPVGLEVAVDLQASEIPMEQEKEDAADLFTLSVKTPASLGTGLGAVGARGASGFTIRPTEAQPQPTYPSTIAASTCARSSSRPSKSAYLRIARSVSCSIGSNGRGSSGRAFKTAPISSGVSPASCAAACNSARRSTSSSVGVQARASTASLLRLERRLNKTRMRSPPFSSPLYAASLGHHARRLEESRRSAWEGRAWWKPIPLPRPPARTQAPGQRDRSF